MKIVAFAKYGSDAASTRQRILQYGDRFLEAGISLECWPLLGNDYVRSLSDGRHVSKFKVGLAYLKRMRMLISGPPADLYWVYADLFPYLPAAFDQLLFKKSRPVVVDWDDAFFDLYGRHRNPIVRRLFRGKLDKLIDHADAITCGNRYLFDYAERFRADRLIVPTVVDTEQYRPAKREGPLMIGWIGSPSTWPNCRPVLPLIADLCEQHGARFKVVGAGSLHVSDRHPRFEFLEWSGDREVADVQSFDIGIAPLLDEPFQRGKSGYKLVQYMACGAASVASPVGVQAEMMDGERCGFLARSQDEWRIALSRLLSDRSLRDKISKTARASAIKKYSLDSQAPRLISLFKQLAAR